MRRYLCVIGLIAGILSGKVFVAQTGDWAVITGRVLDPSGAVIPGVSLMLRNEATGYAYSMNSSDRGTFTFPILPIGSYVLTADSAGFQTLKVAPIRLALNQHLDLPLTLKVGNQATAVTVSTEVNGIETSSAALRTVVTEKQMQDLPVIAGDYGRSIQGILLQLVPGASDYDTSYADFSGGTTNPPKISFNGSPVGGAGFTLNGIDNTAYSIAGGGPISGGPNQDAVAEFSILTQSFNAEAGNMGAQVSVETKSGTNDFHGQLRFLHTDPALAARDFFDQPGTKSTDRSETGGVQFSGPVWLPRIYNGRNKTLFFFDNELSRSRDEYSDNTTVLSNAERAGDFSALPMANWPIDPQTGNPFPNGLIPSNRVVPQARQFIDGLMPQPTVGNTFLNPASIDREFTQQNTGRIDHRFSERDTIQLSVFESKNQDEGPDITMQQRTFLSQYWSDSEALRHTHTFSSSAMNSFAFGRSFHRSASDTSGKLMGNFKDSGFNITSDALLGYPAIQFNDTGSYFQTGYRNSSQTTLWTLKDDFAFTMGAHSLKAGAAVRILRDAQEGISGSPLYFTFSDSNPNGTGIDAADLLLGLPSAYTQTGENNLYARRAFSAFYIQDDLKVRSNLTFNLGMRYELSGAWSDAGGHRAVFAPGSQSKIVASAPVGMLFPGDIDPVTNQALGKAVNSADRNNWAPRVGIAYSRGRTSIRAGYGVYYIPSPPDAIYKAFTVPPWTYSASLDATSLQQSGGTFANPWGNGLDPYTLPVTQRTVVRPVAGIYFVEPKAKDAYQQQWSLSISRQLASHVAFSVNYVGNTAMHLYRRYQVNPAIVTPTATINNAQSRRPYSDFGAIWAFAADGRSDYHALQVDVNRRFTSRFQFNGSYVWSKGLDNAGPALAQFLGSPTAVVDRDVNPRGRSDYDRTHQFVFTGVLELPAPPVSWLHPILSGWQMNSIVEGRSGTPLNLRNSSDSTLRGSDTFTTAELVGTFRRLDPREVHTFVVPNGRIVTGHFFFDPTVFQVLNPIGPAQARPGNLGRNSFTGLGRNNVNMSLMKRITVAERHKIELRADISNLFNHAEFVQTSVGSVFVGNGGQTNHTMGPRRVQIALKYNF